MAGNLHSFAKRGFSFVPADAGTIEVYYMGDKIGTFASMAHARRSANDYYTALVGHAVAKYDKPIGNER